MKKILFLGFALFSSTVLITSCLQSSSKEDTKAKKVSYTLTDTPLNFSLDLSFDENGEVSLSSDEEIKISAYLVRIFPDLNLQSVDSISVLTYIDSRVDINHVISTLVAWGANENISDIPIACEFHSSTDGLIKAGKLHKGSTHYCIGLGCNCCGFIQREISDQIIFTGPKSINQKVIGCLCDTISEDCDVKSGGCNHNISSG